MISKDHLEVELKDLNNQLGSTEKQMTELQKQYNALVGAILMVERLLKKIQEDAIESKTN